MFYIFWSIVVQIEWTSTTQCSWSLAYKVKSELKQGRSHGESEGVNFAFFPLLQRGYTSKSAHFKNRYFPETNRPNSANSSLPMGIVIVLRIKQKWRRNLRWFPTENGKKKYKQRSFNQSINHWIAWECADFEAYPHTVSTQGLGGVRVIFSPQSIQNSALILNTLSPYH